MIDLNKKRKFKLNNWMLFILCALSFSLGAQFIIWRWVSLSVFAFIIGFGLFVVVIFKASNEFLE